MSKATGQKEVISSDNHLAKYCFETCKFERNDKKNGKQLEMIQCSSCHQWYHNDCVWLKKDACPEIWLCSECSKTYKEMFQFKKCLSETITHLRDSLNRAYSEIDQRKVELKEAREECIKLSNDSKLLSDEINALRIRIATIERDNQGKAWQSFKNKRCLLIGDSLIRNIDEEKLVRTCVKEIPDGKVSDISHELVDSLEQEEPHGRIFLCVGTHDCADPELDVAGVTRTYEKLIEEITNTGMQTSNIVVSSIPPRKDKEENQKRIEALNSSLKDMSARLQVTYVDNDLSFKLADGDINDGYLLPSDGLHLTKQGTNKLAKNLQLPVKNNSSSDVTKAWHKTRSKNKLKQKPLTTSNTMDSASNDDDADKPLPGQLRRSSHQRVAQLRRRYSADENIQPRDRYDGHYHASHASYESPRFGNRRCGYCAEHNHSTTQCGFRKPAVCRQCRAEGHKQKFCSEFNASW